MLSYQRTGSRDDRGSAGRACRTDPDRDRRLQYEEIIKNLNTNIKNVVLALFACILFIGSCVLSLSDMQPKTPTGQPATAAFWMVVSFALGIYTVKKMTKKK